VVGVRLVERLVLEQGGRQRVELVSVLAEENGDLVMRGRHEPPYLLVDQLQGLGGDFGYPGQERPLAV
jgi:hypothetical protein